MNSSCSDTPVLLTIFNRPDTARQVFEAIARAKPKKLYVAADAPRPDVDGESEKCLAARELITKVDWDCEVKTLFHQTNIGCKHAMTTAINWLFEHEQEGIILEDDCLPDDSFFGYCSELLSRYQHDTRITMIAGTNVYSQSDDLGSSYYFSQIMHIWGWATWKRAWELNDVEMSSLPKFHQSNRHLELFKDENIALYWLRLWLYTYVGKINTWDYPWVYACLTNHGLAVMPAKNMISNIGFGADGTHTLNSQSSSANMTRHPVGELIHPEQIYCNTQADLIAYEKLRVYPYKASASFSYRLKRRRRLNKYKSKIKKLLQTTPIHCE